MIKVKPEAMRSAEENAYYHAVVVKHAAETLGMKPKQAHQWIKTTFGVQSTATLTTREFEKLMDKIRAHFYHNLGVDIPLPNEG